MVCFGVCFGVCGVFGGGVLGFGGVLWCVGVVSVVVGVCWGVCGWGLAGSQGLRGCQLSRFMRVRAARIVWLALRLPGSFSTCLRAWRTTRAGGVPEAPSQGFVLRA